MRVLVRASFDESRKRYGSPRVRRDLIEQGIRVSPKRVARLMQQDGLVARRASRFKNTTMSDHDQPVAPNLLDRQFEAQSPNQRWVGDTTELLISSKREALPGGDTGPVLEVHRGLVGQRGQRSTLDDQGARDEALKRRCPDAGLLASLRPGLHLCQRRLPKSLGVARHHVQHESSGELLRQRGDGELLLDGEE